MTQKTVILTGASGGLGKGIAVQLGHFGANVVLTGRRENALTATSWAVESAGGQAAIVIGDLSDVTTIEQIINTAVNKFGGIDAVINNAGILGPVALIENTTIEDWHTTFEINLFAPVMLSQAALPYLRASDGRVINVSSDAALNGYPARSAYSASKAALNQFTRSLSAEEEHITVVSVRPGNVDTKMQAIIRQRGKDVMPDVYFEAVKEMHDSGGLLEPDKPGQVIAILSLHAPPDWSGNFVNWDDTMVERLCMRVLHEMDTDANV